MHVLSTPPAFVLSQDQTLHEKTLKQKVSTQFSDQREKPDQKILKKTNWHSKKDLTTKKYWHQTKFVTHYRVLKEHTPTNTTSNTAGELQRAQAQFWNLPPSPGQLHQPSKPDPRPQTRSPGSRRPNLLGPPRTPVHITAHRGKHLRWSSRTRSVFPVGS